MLKKIVVFLAFVSTAFFLSGCSLKKAPSALQVNTTPEASVFIDGKQVGKTPYQKSDFKPGEVTIKLIPESVTTSLISWESKINLSSGVLTLIERNFASTEAASSGYILSLEKIKDNQSSALSIISDPDGALIKINGEAKGFSPLTIDKTSEGEYEIVLSKDGYTEKKIKAKAVLGYKLIVNLKLAQTLSLATVTVTPTAMPSGKATPSVKTTPSVKVTPTTKLTPTGTVEIPKPYILIKETPTGWLRVRSEPKTTSTELAKVNPGEKYPLLEEQTGWYKISYASGKEGWISSQYGQKFE